MSRSKKAFDVADLPALSTIPAITFALALFGSDAPASSLTVSALIFSITATTLLAYSDARLQIWTIPFIATWAALFGIHHFTGRASDGEHEYLMLLAGGCAFWLGRHGASSRRRRQRILNAIAVFAFLFALYAFLQHAISPHYILGALKAYHRERLTGPFLSANTAATFFGLLFLLLVYRIVRHARLNSTNQSHSSVPGAVKNLLDQPMTFSAALLVMTCLVLTGSRAGFFAAAISIVILMIGFAFDLRSKGSARLQLSGWNIALVISSIVLTGLGIWSLSGATLETRMGLEGSGLDQRRVMIEASWAAGNWEPWLGHGLNSLDYATYFQTTAETNRAIVAQNASHNLFAQWYMQAGWPGLIGVCAMILMSCMFALFSNQSASIRGLRIAVIALVVSHGFFDYALEIPAFFLFFAFISGLLVSPNSYREKN